MSVEIPELDNPISYVVVDGVALGPMLLATIVESISLGERADDSFVWWIGSTEWIPFNSNDDLMALLAKLEEPEAQEPEAQELEEVDDSPVLIDLTTNPDLEAEPEPEPEVEFDDEPESLFAEISVAPKSVLSDLGARLEALSSATRHLSATSKLDRAGAAPIEQSAAESDPLIINNDELSTVRSSTLNTTFDALVRQTVTHGRLADESHRVSELLARACAAAFTRHGYTVERNSDTPGHHQLLFTERADQSQIRLLLTPAPSVRSGHVQSICVQMFFIGNPLDVDEASRAVRQRQLQGPIPGAGAIDADIDCDTGLVSTSVELVWPVDDYIGPDFTVDHESLNASLDAISTTLESTWLDLFSSAE